jgi:hypothetical protein
VIFALYSTDGEAVWQASPPQVAVRVGAITSASTVFTVPSTLAPGTYTFTIGVYSPDQTVRYAADDALGTLTIPGGLATETASGAPD